MDTHTLLWGLDGDEHLSIVARRWIETDEHRILISAASAWEIATKVRIGKLPGAQAVAANFHACVIGQGFTPLDITADHALRAGSLPGPHRDPFDRMLVCQAIEHDCVLLTPDPLITQYPVRTRW